MRLAVLDRLPDQVKSERARQVAVAVFILIWIVAALWLHLSLFHPVLHVALVYAIPIMLAGQFFSQPIAIGFTALAIIAHSIDASLDRDTFFLWLSQTLVLIIVAYLAIRGRQRQQDEALLAAELDATITSIAEGLLVYDSHGQITRMNTGAEDILGYTPSERQRPLEERLKLLRLQSPDGRLIPPEQTPPMRALRGETVRGLMLVLHRPPNRSIWVLVSAAPILTSEDQLLGATVTITDITPLHELQEQREDLLRAVSHDLRSPLTVIQGHAQLLQRTLPRTEATESSLRSVHAILKDARRMNTMIQDLVDSARMEAGQLRLEKKPIDLRSFLPDLLERAATGMDIKRVRTELPTGLPPILADPDRLDRILLNLLSNALKYSTPGTEVLIRAHQTDGSVAVSVTDHGPGIAPENLPHLFQRYYRVGRPQEKEGIGLGLYISRILVEAHGGRIWAESQPGVGSTFTFEIPRAPTPSDHERESDRGTDQDEG